MWSGGDEAAFYPATKIYAQGMFEALIADRQQVFSCELEVLDFQGEICHLCDP